LTTDNPAAHSIPAMMSESYPLPPLPSARTGRIQAPQVIAAMPMPLLLSAPMMPTTRVPCQELGATVSLANSGFCWSVAVTQSPGSEGSGSQPSPSLAIRYVPSAAPLVGS
jgi:hypothetical protein